MENKASKVSKCIAKSVNAAQLSQVCICDFNEAFSVSKSNEQKSKIIKNA